MSASDDSQRGAKRVAQRVPSDYVLRLRDRIGHDLLVMPSVTVLLFDEQDRVLLVRHSDRDVWVAPGGMVEPDEDPEETARREMREETGVDVDLVSILGVFGGPEFRVTYRNGDQVGYVMTVFEARMAGGEPTPDLDETLDVGFFTRDQVGALDVADWLPTVAHRLALSEWEAARA